MKSLFEFTALTKVHMSPLYRGLRQWDALSSSLQKEKDYDKFKADIAKLNL